MGDERFVRAGFEDFATLAQDVDPICLFHRLQTVGDDDDRASFKKLVQSIGNGRFGE